MTEPSKTWRSTTTTRSWSTSSSTSDDPQEAFSTLRGVRHDTQANVCEQWRYVGGDGDGRFEVEIKDGAVTVNGRRYDSMDEVPRADRDRIEAVRNGLDNSGLWDVLRQAGVDIGGLAGSDTRHAAGKPEFIMETDIPDVRGAASAHDAPTPAAQAMDAPAPGAAPRNGGGLRRIVLVVVGVGLAWWILRLTGAV